MYPKDMSTSMMNSSSPENHSPFNSTRPFLTWSPSSYSSFLDDQDTTPGASQPSPSQPSNILSSNGNKEPCRGYDHIHNNRGSDIHLNPASSSSLQDVTRCAAIYGSPGYESLSWSRNDAALDHSGGLASFSMSQPDIGIMGQSCYSSHRGHIGDVAKDQCDSAGVCPTGFDSPYARTGSGNVLEATGDCNAIFSVGGHDNRMPNKAREYLRNSPGSEQDTGDGLIRCLIPGCRTNHGFKTKQTFVTHLRNAHVPRLAKLTCLVDNCPRPGPYANKTDLNRHYLTHSSAKPYRCQRPNCPARTKEWARKDKLKPHDRKYHSNFKCFLCSQNPRFERWFEYASELWEHTQEKHPGFYG